MNNFAQIKPIAKYKKVAYYSICINGKDNSIFEEFIAKHEHTNKNKLNHIVAWLTQIGENYGAQERHFRPEAETADASALPPPGSSPPHYTENGKKKSNTLRLYCLRANESVVFLFNGGIKTKKRAQDCPNVRDHFKLANLLTKAINESFKDKEIRWINDYTEIDCEENLKIFY